MGPMQAICCVPRTVPIYAYNVGLILISSLSFAKCFGLDDKLPYHHSCESQSKCLDCEGKSFYKIRQFTFSLILDSE